MKKYFIIIVAIFMAVNLQADWKSISHQSPITSDTTNSFGDSVSLGAIYKVVGSPEDGLGVVYVYKKIADEWQQINKLYASNADINCSYNGSAIIGDCNLKGFGASVSLSESSVLMNQNPHLIVIGAPNSYDSFSFTGDTNRGAFCTYTINGDNTVTQLGECVMGGADENLGYSVDSSNYTSTSISLGGGIVVTSHAKLVVGNPNKEMDNNEKQGQVEFYDFNGTAWDDKATATVQTPGYYARFGHSVSIYKDEVLIGAWGADADDNEKGLAFIHNANGAWQETIALDAAFGNYENFGKSVDIYGDNMIIAYDMLQSGIFGDNTEKGRVNIYKREDGVWTQTNYISDTTDSLADDFGHSVSINNNYAVVAAPTNTYSIPKNEEYKGGGAFIYVKDEVGIWNLDKEINGLNNSKFGQSVSVYGDNIMVGASGSSSQTTTTYEYYETVKASPAIIMYLLN